MAWDKEYKATMENVVSNFKANCRFKKVTDRDLFDNVFKTELSFHSFQTTLKNNPLALLKDDRNLKAMQKLHQELIAIVNNENKRFLKKVKK